MRLESLNYPHSFTTLAPKNKLSTKPIYTMLRSILTIFILSISLYAFSQINLNDLQAGFEWRNIGPANQGGRIIDIQAVDNDFKHVIMATASGGVWKSENAGNTWTPIFDNYETASIGDIAVSRNNRNLIWVGTGEANNRNSVSWGNGIYKSSDGGKTFQNKGLKNTHQIARVVPNDKNDEEVCVCAIGHLWGYSGDRGLFQTKNGGNNWQKLTKGLPNDGKTGCIDLVQNATDNKIKYAAFYHRLRQPWHFHSGNEGGGIYKTTDGGKSWKKLTEGLPTETGRIGLAIYDKNPNIIMAIVEAEKTNDLTKPGSGVYRSEDGGATWKYVNTYNYRPFYYSQIRINPSDDQRVYVLTTPFMVSEDGGKTFKNGSKDQEVHGDFHSMWIDPNDKDRYYLGADKGMSITHNHGKHFTLFDNLPIGQFYRINYDYRDPYYVYGGLQDNGMYGVASFTREARGILNDDNWKLHWGDGQYVHVNPNNWREVYTSMENGSYFSYDPLTHHLKRINPNRDNIINFKDYFPELPKDMRSTIRNNWSSPFIMSPHSASTFYAGSNHVYKSADKGKTWKIISPDLTTNAPEKRIHGKSGGITPDNTGAETHCAIFSISVSPIHENVIWVGTDDGNVQLTKNGGKSWINLRKNIPEALPNLWVSKVEASHFQQGTAYVTFDGHRSDHFGTWIFRTDDFGQTWQKITTGISKNEVVRTIIEDHKNPNLLFIGTETGVWYSINRGNTWQRFMKGLPTVSVYDLKIHERDNDLIAGTHGRSIWVMDDISPLQQINASVLQSKGFLFEQRQTTLWENTSRGGQRGHFLYAGQNPKTIQNTSTKPRAGFRNLAAISYYLSKNVNKAQLIISDLKTKNKKIIDLKSDAGIHRHYWNLEFDTKAYTPAEEAQIDDIFKKLMITYTSSSIKRLYGNLKKAKTGAEQRRIMERLTTGYLTLDIPNELLMPKAKVGSYKLELVVDGVGYLSILEVRADPILRE